MIGVPDICGSVVDHERVSVATFEGPMIDCPLFQVFCWFAPSKIHSSDDDDATFWAEEEEAGVSALRPSRRMASESIARICRGLLLLRFFKPSLYTLFGFLRKLSLIDGLMGFAYC